ncbi:hypothetical protein [Micromonospora lupini]|uniref:Uncharacterized protein n=1 Tax=Micromonospora lupini str. Lupac 08 TaxID=1150864 RepID=I0L7Y9_9ACTN|nr:hypothetical protein [Micromonospora lupini]CCH19936.1 Exported hypothetical protein [Micromonospora lupini str. Lupac 08]
MTSETAPRRRRTKRVLVAVAVTVGLLSCLWVLWFLSLRVFGDEGALPPKSRLPEVPAGASVVDESTECASGGCWRQLTVAPAAGQTPEDLAREMGLTEERKLPPTLFDPGSVYVGARVADGRLIVHVGYE